MSAQAEDDYEETQTDSNGDYRLRGLTPGKNYRLQLKGGPDGSKHHVKTSVPEYSSVTIGKEDVHGVDFIAFAHSNFSTVAVSINAPKEFLSSLKLELHQTMGSGIILFKEITVHALSYFEFHGVPVGQYVLKLSSGLSKNQFRFNDIKENILVEFGDTRIHTTLNFDIQAHDDFAESTVLPYPFLFVLIVIVYCTFHYKTVHAILQNPSAYFEEKSPNTKGTFLPSNLQPSTKKNFSAKKAT